MDERKQKLSVNIIGAGLVGKMIGKRIVATGCVEIHSVMNANLDSALSAVENIGQGSAVSNEADLYPADITFITTPDDLIKSSFLKIAKLKKFKKNSIVVHCSGVKTANLLKEINSSEVYIARAHPVKHISSVQEAVENFNGTRFVLEGDDQACNTIHHLLNQLGGEVLKIPKQNDCLYHTACVLATTFHQMLICASSQLYEACGLDRATALSLSKELSLNSLSSLNTNGQYADFIEGPIKRADAAVAMENRLSIADKKISAIYESLGRYAISLTNHDSNTKENLLDSIAYKS